MFSSEDVEYFNFFDFFDFVLLLDSLWSDLKNDEETEELLILILFGSLTSSCFTEVGLSASLLDSFIPLFQL